MLGPVTVLLQRTSRSRPFTAHVDKLKAYLGNAPASWLKREKPKRTPKRVSKGDIQPQLVQDASPDISFENGEDTLSGTPGDVLEHITVVESSQDATVTLTSEPDTNVSVPTTPTEATPAAVDTPMVTLEEPSVAQERCLNDGAAIAGAPPVTYRSPRTTRNRRKPSYLNDYVPR